ncbi:hypothetical protein E2C01_021087 [Portunus trituberculatus]|uniref:Uncharacterized protein n=1 Tax=Portunus trituberculatus TaxID=210409 RepID=A0A5B7E2B4_PORTR|nr:hypothetical protein [Portunus trituberculatus]
MRAKGGRGEAGKRGRVRVLECLAPWLCISAARPVGSVGSGAARHNQQEGQQEQQQQQEQHPGEPPAGWLRDTRTTPPDRSRRPHSAPAPITATMVKTFQPNPTQLNPSQRNSTQLNSTQLSSTYPKRPPSPCTCSH